MLFGFTPGMVFSGLLAFSVHCAAFGAEPVFVGQTAPFSGQSKSLGLDARRGIEAYLSYVNKNGGINGRMVLLKSFDDRGSASVATENARKLIREEGVIALVASIGTRSSEAVAEVATAARTPLVAPFSGAASLRANSRNFVYNVRPEIALEAQNLARQISSMGIERVVAVFQNDADGVEAANTFERACRDSNLVLAEKLEVDATNSTVQNATRSLQKIAPQAVVVFATYDVGVEVVRASRAAGYGGVFMAASSAGSKALNEQLLEAARGVGMTQVMPLPWSKAVRLVNDYQKRMSESGFGRKDFSYGSLEGYVAARVLVEGLRRSGSDPSSQRLAIALDNLGELDLSGIRIFYSPQRRESSRFVDLTVIGPDGEFRK